MKVKFQKAELKRYLHRAWVCAQALPLTRALSASLSLSVTTKCVIAQHGCCEELECCVVFLVFLTLT